MIDEYKEDSFQCSNARSAITDPFLFSCAQVPKDEIELRFSQDPYVSFVVKAVSALTAAFRLVQLEHCANALQSNCFPNDDLDLHDQILENLRRLSFTSMMPGDDSSRASRVKGTQHYFARNGRLVANKQQIYAVSLHNGLEQVKEKLL